MEQAYNIVFTVTLIGLAVLVVLCLVRSVIGPSIADRIVAANMTGTLVMVIIAILAVKLKEGYLADVCLIYAMISFLAVIVLTKVYTGVYLRRKAEQEERRQQRLDVEEKEEEEEKSRDGMH